MDSSGEPDAVLLQRLRQGDERAFAAVVDAYSPALLRLARTFVPSRAVAEEVLQETWLGVLRGLEGFEGRSSLRTWVFRILSNTARKCGARERRTVPFSALAAAEAADGEPPVDPDRFLPADRDRWPHHWGLGPTRWETPDEGLLAAETRAVILAAVEALPQAQRAVLGLRDLEGWPAAEVCDALEVSEGNQRVLLHRARTRLRAALEAHFGAVEATVG